MEIDGELLQGRHAKFLVQRLSRWAHEGRYCTQYVTPLAEAAEKLLAELVAAHPELLTRNDEDSERGPEER